MGFILHAKSQQLVGEEREVINVINGVIIDTLHSGMKQAHNNKQTEFKICP